MQETITGAASRRRQCAPHSHPRAAAVQTWPRTGVPPPPTGSSAPCLVRRPCRSDPDSGGAALNTPDLMLSCLRCCLPLAVAVILGTPLLAALLGPQYANLGVVAGLSSFIFQLPLMLIMFEVGPRNRQAVPRRRRRRRRSHGCRCGDWQASPPAKKQCHAAAAAAAGGGQQFRLARTASQHAFRAPDGRPAASLPCPCGSPAAALRLQLCQRVSGLYMRLCAG